LAQSTNVLSLASLIVVDRHYLRVRRYEPERQEVNLSITTSWILSSPILYVIALALSLAVMVPALRGAGEKLRGDTAAGGEYKRVAMASGIVTLPLIVVVVLMVAKPGRRFGRLCKACVDRNCPTGVLSGG